jgi:hypothetical protein
MMLLCQRYCNLNVIWMDVAFFLKKNSVQSAMLPVFLAKKWRVQTSGNPYNI